MPRGIIIDRKNISFVSYPKTPKEGSHPRLVLRNGEILDKYLTLQFRNFDFNGNMFSFYGLENNSPIENDQCAFIELTKLYDGGDIIEDMILTDDEIIERLLK